YCSSSGPEGPTPSGSCSSIPNAMLPRDCHCHGLCSRALFRGLGLLRCKELFTPYTGATQMSDRVRMKFVALVVTFFALTLGNSYSFGQSNLYVRTNLVSD